MTENMFIQLKYAAIPIQCQFQKVKSVNGHFVFVTSHSSDA